MKIRLLILLISLLTTSIANAQRHTFIKSNNLLTNSRLDINDDDFEDSNVHRFPLIEGGNKKTISINTRNTVEALGTYTLIDDDVTIVDGIITKYNNETEKDIIIPESLQGQIVISIGRFAFYNKQLTNVVIPNSVTTFEVMAFSTNKLPSIEFSTNVISIDDFAFGDNELISVIIPNSVTHIGKATFNRNRIITLNGNPSKGIIYARKEDGTEDETTIVSFGGIDDIIDFIPSYVTTIGSTAFEDNELTSISIPNTVTEIGGGAFNMNSITTVNGLQSKGIIYARNNDGSDDTNTIISYGGISTVIDFIPSTVTTIGEYAFYYNSLTDVTIPNSITTIGEYAFYYNSLTNVTIPNSVIFIGDHAFRSNQLSSITLPNSITSIGRSVFNSNLLTNVTIPNTVTSIGKWAFSNNELENISIPSSVTSIEYSAFYTNKITSIIIPNSVIFIGDHAFRSNQLSSITLPNSITSIGRSVFNSNLLTNVTIPNTVTSIGKWAFYNNLLTDVTIPPSVTTIKRSAFNTNKLTSLIIPNSVNFIGDWAFASNELTSLVISNTTTSIGDGTFYFNQLTDVTIPKSVTSIGNYAFLDNNLTSFVLPISEKDGYDFENWNGSILGNTEVTDLDTKYIANFSLNGNPVYTLTDDDVEVVDGVLISYNNSETNIIIPEVLDNQRIIGIGYSAFARKLLKSVSIPNTTTFLEEQSFSENELKEINIPNSIYSIGIYAFGHNNLSELSLPNSIEFVDKEAFSDNELENIVLPKSIHYIGNMAFNNNQIKMINGVASNGIIYSRNKDGSDNLSEIISYGGLSKDINFIPNNVKYIADYAFAYNSIINVTIPNSVIIIGYSAFENNNLTRVMIGNSVKVIKEEAFVENMITTLSIGTSVDSICAYAFVDNQLTSILIPNSVSTIEEGAFAGNKLSEVTIPTSVNYIGKFSFDGNDLTSFVLPASEKTGYLFEDWNVGIPGNTEVYDLGISYTANFSENLEINDYYIDNINIYPNPSSGVFHLTGSDFEIIEVINSMGQPVKFKKSNNQNETSIELGDISRGIYFVKARSENSTFFKRIIIK